MCEEKGYEPESDIPTPEEHLLASELKIAIAKGMEQLTEKQKIIVHKTFWEEKTLREIGKEMGIDNKTVHEYLESAKKKLKKFLKNF